jgi:hypothetical protein
VKGAVLRLRRPDHFTSIVDTRSNIAGGASQIAEVDGRAIAFPEHGFEAVGPGG